MSRPGVGRPIVRHSRSAGSGDMQGLRTLFSWNIVFVGKGTMRESVEWKSVFSLHAVDERCPVKALAGKVDEPHGRYRNGHANGSGYLLGSRLALTVWRNEREKRQQQA